MSTVELLRRALKRVRIVYRRSSLLLKCIVLTTLVLSTVTVVALSVTRLRVQKDLERQRQEAAALERENQELRDKISVLGTVDSVRQIAGDVLDLVDPDTIVFDAE